MNRRTLMSFIGGTAASALLRPQAARAQQAMSVIGFLSSSTPAALPHLAAAFRQSLGASGYVEGQNLSIEYRWAQAQNDRLPALAADLVDRRVSVIAAQGPAAALAAKAATTTIPVVFTSGEDPVKIGLVASYNRPGGNVTGVAALIEALGAKRLGLLREVVPVATSIAVLLNPTEPAFDTQLKDIEEAARAIGQNIHVLRASTDREIDAAFATAGELQAGAMLVGVSFFYTIRREQLVALAARAALPTIYGQREFISAGGLMSYATNLAEVYRQAGIYTGRILKGVKPADLPVMETTKFEFVINVRTAKSLGIKISDNLLSLADEVIE